MINTLKLKESLEANGFSSTQASVLSHAINDTSVEQSSLATKEELHEVRNELKGDIKEVREQVKDVRDQVKDMRNELSDFKKHIEKRIDNFQDSILDKLTNRTLLSQIAIAAILISIMIYFHQNP